MFCLSNLEYAREKLPLVDDPRTTFNSGRSHNDPN